MEHQTGRKAYKYKLHPTPKQEGAMEPVLLRGRTLYNGALEQRQTWWERGQGKSATYNQQATQLPDLKAACSEYGAVHSQVFQAVLRRVDKTSQACFRRIANGETPGYPRFQGVNRYHSFTYPQSSTGTVLDGSTLSLSRIGRIAIRLHRPLRGTPKPVTIVKEADGWYAGISCTDVPVEPLPRTGEAAGIDVGLKVFLLTADGEGVEHPRYSRKAQKHLAKAQRRVSRRKKGSKRRKKAVALLKRKYQQVQRQRSDFHHQTALYLLRAYDTIYLEDLRVANLVRNRHLAKSISDAGWGQFRTILEGKAVVDAGRRVVAVPPCHPRTRRRTAVACCPMGTAVHSGWRNACRSAPLSVPPVDWS